jgi:hypothetical protein
MTELTDKEWGDYLVKEAVFVAERAIEANNIIAKKHGKYINIIQHLVPVMYDNTVSHRFHKEKKRRIIKDCKEIKK